MQFAGEQRLPKILAIITPNPIYLFFLLFKYHCAVIASLCAIQPPPPVISLSSACTLAKKAFPAFFSCTKYVSEVSLLLFTAGFYQLALTMFIASFRSCNDQPQKCTDTQNSDTDPSNSANLALCNFQVSGAFNKLALYSKHLHLGTLQLECSL